jgi:hypothetical protein
MKNKAMVWLLCMALVGSAAAARGQNARRAAGTSTDANLAEQYLQACADHERAGLGLPPLRRDAALVAAARSHALEMARHDAISHQFANEPDLAARGSAAGARFSLISENVAESPSAVKIHDAWMHSEGHRHNLLDPKVDSVGIVVVARGSQLFAVEDFAHILAARTLPQQEQEVAAVVAATGTAVAEADDAARRVCEGGRTGRGTGQPDFTVRYTTASLQQIPEALRSRLASGQYSRAVVAACAPEDGGDFTMYRLAVLLYK